MALCLTGASESFCRLLFMSSMCPSRHSAMTEFTARLPKSPQNISSRPSPILVTPAPTGTTNGSFSAEYFLRCGVTPETNDLTADIMALVAQQEFEAISRRTKEAPAAAKARCVELAARLARLWP